MNRTATFVLVATLAFACNADPLAAAAAARGPTCSALTPLYWEVGNATSVLASGTISSSRRPDRNTVFPIASASKWFYSAYIEQLRGGALTAADVKFLTFKSGYTRFPGCDQGDTVGSCAQRADYVSRNDGFFFYGGGHMQVHAAKYGGLVAANNAALSTAINSMLGTSVNYSSPQLAGGVFTNAAAYVDFLRLVMTDRLVMGKHLLDFAVPTSGPLAKSSPAREPWTYGIGHWIELDGTFSSPGAFGFYPWISADKALYGIVSRQGASGSGDGVAWDSVMCGRAIRDAFRKAAS